jgi:hypothetical protein
VGWIIHRNRELGCFSLNFLFALRAIHTSFLYFFCEFQNFDYYKSYFCDYSYLGRSLTDIIYKFKYISPGGRHPGRHPRLPGGTGRFLRRPRLPAAGRAAGLASSRPGPLAPSPWQPSATGSTPASRQPVAARGPGGAARREQSHGWRICPLAAGMGGGALDSPDHPPPPTRGPRPGLHWPRPRTCRIPCCSRSHPESHA